MPSRKTSRAAAEMAKARAASMSPERRREIAGIAGRSRMTRLTKARRIEIAKKAAAARWGVKKTAG